LKKIAAIQSNYIPWKGYFDIINYVDEFILYDDVQYTKNDWRNRNKIKTHQGVQWLTIPVKAEGGLHKSIKDTQVANDNWNGKHRNAIHMNYAHAKHYKDYSDWLDILYEESPEKFLSKINHYFILHLCEALGISTPIAWVMDYSLQETDKNLRLVELCKKTGADVYVSGPAAQSYMDIKLFEQAGIDVEFFDYSEYPEYPQLHPPFEHFVSVIDLLLNAGGNSANFMKTIIK